MKKVIACGVVFLLTLSAVTAQHTGIRLIVRGDDMGYSHSGNTALIRCFTNGIEKSIEVIVSSPWFPEAVKLLEQHPTVDVGVHLAITSEWSNLKWRPLTDCVSLKDKDGYFFPMVFPNKNYPGQSVKENSWNIDDIEKEFRAQIEMAKRKIPRVSHISAHMGCIDLSPEVKAMALKLATEYNINIDTDKFNVKAVGYVGTAKTSAQKTQSFIKMLASLRPGNTYLFVDHPGLNNDELRGIWHIGYENVAQDRQGVTDIFTSNKIKAIIKRKGIELISYKDLLKK